MKIGLIDVDGNNFPNLPLMKISAYEKKKGNQVEWYSPLLSGHVDMAYMAKVFSFSSDYCYPIDADEIIKGGSGYHIVVSNGIERYEKDECLMNEIEHIYPDYTIYPQYCNERAYGFLTRGCPRGCKFCHVKAKEGGISHKVADLDEFWKGQKKIVLLDPNLLAAKESDDLLDQLLQSKARIDFSQGVDIRLMTESKAMKISQIKCDTINFAWDNYSDGNAIVPKLKMFKEITGWDRHHVQVYVLTNFDSTFEQDMERVLTIKAIGFAPYVMVYNKFATEPSDRCRRFQRWVNMRAIFYSTSFENYKG